MRPFSTLEKLVTFGRVRVVPVIAAVPVIVAVPAVKDDPVIAPVTLAEPVTESPPPAERILNTGLAVVLEAAN